jgi:hypothetical protein
MRLDVQEATRLNPVDIHPATASGAREGPPKQGVLVCRPGRSECKSKAFVRRKVMLNSKADSSALAPVGITFATSLRSV